MDNVVTYRVKVLSKNATIVFRNKKLRTPVECHNVFEHEIDVLKTQMIKDALKYEILREDEVEEKVVEPLVIEKRDSDVKIEELYDPENEPNSIMDRLIAEEKANKE